MKKSWFCFLAALVTVPVFAQVFSSSNLPVIVIDTHNQGILDDPKIVADMGIIFNENGNRNNLTDPFNHYNGKIGIETRGQSSQQFPMKSYGFELLDEEEKSVDGSLFGLPEESDWILYAPYNEKTLMHNFLAYTISREMGHWASNCRYVELVINGEYRGIYVLMEKIKRNKGRVNVSKLNDTDIAGDAVTGGYIFSIDKEADGWLSSFSPNPAAGASIQFSYVYPKLGALTPEQKTYIKSYVDNFETALNGGQYQDPQNGWRKYAEESSFIDFFLVNELSRNVDGYRISTFFHKDKETKGGKIIAGPVWDYDLGFRNADYCNGSDPSGWSYRFNTVCGSDYWQVPFWWDKFLTDSSFQGNLRCRWEGLRQTTLSQAHLYHLIDSIVALTTEARQRHFQRWPVLGQYIWPNPQPIPGNYEEEILALKSWLAIRLQWLDTNIPDKGACGDDHPTGGNSLLLLINPNPIGGNGNIIARSATAQSAGLVIFNAEGRQLYRGQHLLQPGNNTIPVSTGSWPSGVYFVKLYGAAGEVLTQKIIRI